MNAKIKYAVPLKQNHWALWNWLANHPEKLKVDWPGWRTLYRLGIHVMPFCFFCVAFENCHRCPLRSCQSIHPRSIYSRWARATDLTERTALAIRIRDAWQDQIPKCDNLYGEYYE